MPLAERPPHDRRKVEAAGRVVLDVLEEVPDSPSAQVLRELLALGLDDPQERALFDFLGGKGKRGDMLIRVFKLNGR